MWKEKKMNEVLFVKISILSFDRLAIPFIVKRKVCAKSRGNLDEESLWRTKREHFLAVAFGDVYLHAATHLFIKCDLVAYTAFATTAYLSWSSRVQISALSSPLLPNFRTYEKEVRAILARNGPQSADDDVSLERTVYHVCALPSLLHSSASVILDNKQVFQSGNNLE